jgi:hypothetical protein
MPQEDRYIIFEHDEVYKALFSMCEKQQVRRPPAGKITKVVERDDVVDLYLDNYMDNTKPQAEYTKDFLAAALMLFCRGTGIPLPKSAKKSVIIKDNTVMLRVMIGDVKSVLG